MMKLAASSACFCLMLSGVALSQPWYDFSEVTRLAEGSLAGENVGTAVRGFELLLMKDGSVVYDRAFGQWSLGRVGNADSATKTISGAVIMSLVDSSPRPFSLVTRLSDYIPQFSGAKQTITVSQAFSHVAGFAQQSSAVGDSSISLYEAALQIAATPLRYVPGTTFSYGGVSMHAAGAVAEFAGGAPWNTLFSQRIGEPLGLVHTRYVLSGPDNPRIAGGCESNASEFATLMEMLRRGGLHGNVRILSASAVTQMLTRQTPVGVPVANSPLNDSSDYGVGVWLDQRDERGTLIGALAAGARGFSSWIDFDDGMVGAFATDLTTSGNVLNLLYLIRDAAQEAVRDAPPCPADFNRDGGVDGADVEAFFDAWERGDASADVNQDGGVDGGDVGTFFAAWEAGGCG